MKKALTIYIDDDAELTNLCGGFVMWKGDKENSVTFLNESIPKETEGFYLPMKSDGIKGMQWVSETEMVYTKPEKETLQ